MATLLWLQGGACSGNTMSFFNAEEPSLCDLVTDFGIEILWHPSLGMAAGDALQWPHSSFMVPGGVMCAPTLTDMTRSRAILEYWRSTWLEQVWLGCSVDRYLEIKTWHDFETWLDESPAHRDSDLGVFIRFCREVGLDSYGGGVGKYIAYGCAPNHTIYNRPTMAGRNSSLVFRSGFYDGQVYQDFDQARLVEHVAHSWYVGRDARHPFDGLTEPLDPAVAGSEKYSWDKAPRYGDLVVEAGPLAREILAARPGAQPWQEYDPLFKNLFDQFGPSIMLRVWARMHEAAKFYQRAVEFLDAVNLREPFYIKPKESEGEGFGATEAIRGGLAHWIKIKGGKIENYQIVAPTSINVSPRDAAGNIRGPGSH